MGFGKKLAHMAQKSVGDMLATQRAINRTMDVVMESLALCQDSPKPETRISRMQVAIASLRSLIENYPFWPDVDAWKRQENELRSGFPEFLMTNIAKLIADEIIKIEKLKKQQSQHSRAEKFVTKLATYFEMPNCDATWLQAQISLLKKAYPPEGQLPVKDIAIPTCCSMGNISDETLIPSVPHRAEHTPKKDKRVSLILKACICLGWLVLLQPLAQQGGGMYPLVTLVASVGLTALVVLWIRKR